MRYLFVLVVVAGAPLLVQHCGKCHGESMVSGDLRLDIPDVIRDFDIDYLLAPGKPEENELLNRLTLAEDDELQMPKDAPPLPQSEIALVRQWITMGAELTGRAKEPVSQPEVPIVEPASADAILRLRQSGAVVAPLFDGSPFCT